MNDCTILSHGFFQTKLDMRFLSNGLKVARAEET
jgi:hypothetical protein